MRELTRVCVCVSMRVCVCVHACVCASMRVCVSVSLRERPIRRRRKARVNKQRTSTSVNHRLAVQRAVCDTALRGGGRVVLILLYVAYYLDLYDGSSRGGIRKPSLPPVYISFEGA